ncbi:MAG: hypothetical protein IJF73_04900 [Clostridia bacterium]|nr:hypothetical protein [Clostridia bacterium]
MPHPTATPAATVCRTATVRPREGLCLTYRLLVTDRALVEVTAADGRGIRRESVGGFPTAAAAERFFDLVAAAAVTPYTLLEIYDGFLAEELAPRP